MSQSYLLFLCALGMFVLQSQASQYLQPGAASRTHHVSRDASLEQGSVPNSYRLLTERQVVAVRSVPPLVCLAAAAGGARYAAVHADNNGRVLTFGLFAVAGLIATDSIMNLRACWKRYRALPNQEPVHPATAVPFPEERG